MAYLSFLEYPWALVALRSLDVLHFGVLVLLFWPLWGQLPSYLDAVHTGLVLSLVPVQILCGGLCPIVWLQQCIVQGQASWFTQPFVYKWVVALSPWPVTEGIVSVVILGAQGVFVVVVVIQNMRAVESPICRR